MSNLPSVEDVIAELKQRGFLMPEGPVRLDEYGDSPELETELIELIKSGKKRASAALVWSYEFEGMNLPNAGDLEIVVNSAGSPTLLTRIVSVEVVPFSQVTEEHAALEGEGDLSLKYWRQTHWEFFARECAHIARNPTPEMPVLCMRFELLDVYS